MGKDAVTNNIFFTGTDDGQQPQIGQRFDISLQNQQWHVHPNPNIDITITPLVPILKSISHNLIATLDQINQRDALENIVFVGYPNGQFGYGIRSGQSPQTTRTGILRKQAKFLLVVGIWSAEHLNAEVPGK